MNNIPFERLARYEGLDAELLYYMDIIKYPAGGGYYYRTLFRVHAERKKLLVVERMPLELGFVKYSSLADYKIGERGTLHMARKKGIAEKLKIEIPRVQKVVKLGDVLSQKSMDYGFESARGRKSFNGELLGQYAVITGNLLFPCGLIASKFFFTSSRIVHHILTESIDKAYDYVKVHKDHVKVALKPGYANTDALLIAFLDSSEYAQETYKDFARKLRTSFLQGRFPLYAVFPFHGIYEMQVRYEEIESYRYVHEISAIEPDPYKGLKVVVVRLRKKNADGKVKILKIPQEVADEDVEGFIPGSPAGKLYKTANIRIAFERGKLSKVKVIHINWKVKEKLIKQVFYEKGSAPITGTTSAQKFSSSDTIGMNFQRDFQEKELVSKEWNLSTFLYLIS